MSNVKSVEILCNVSKGEIATTVQHIEAERVVLNDREADTTGKVSHVEIKARRFFAYSRTPRACTGAIESAARREYGPSVPVTVAFC